MNLTKELARKRPIHLPNEWLLTRVALWLQYDASERVWSTRFASMFYLQIYIFLSGADGIRTHALRRAKASWHVLVCPTASSDFDVLQVFFEVLGDYLSVAYQLVPARLQYGCSTFAQVQYVPGN
jgi:hypothetical protein